MQTNARRQSPRLAGRDYTLPGAYFVTICNLLRECLFDDPVLRHLAQHTWRTVVCRHASIERGDFVVMPNHVHGIIWIPGSTPSSHGVAASHPKPPGPTHLTSTHLTPSRLDVGPGDSPLRRSGTPRGSLGAIVGSYKAVAAKRINRHRRTPRANVWQRNYYDRIIRNEHELDRIRMYILDNPAKWSMDIHPENAPVDWELNL